MSRRTAMASPGGRGPAAACAALFAVPFLLAPAALAADPPAASTPPAASACSGGEEGEAPRADTVPDLRPSASPVPCGLRPRLMAVAGIHGFGADASHGYLGVEGGLLGSRFGLMGIGQYGTGNGFRSLLVAGGPAVELVDFDHAALTFYGGVARYEERDSADFVRDMVGLFGGLSVRVPLPVGAVGVSASFWHGSFDEVGLESSVGVTGHRFSLGFGL